MLERLYEKHAVPTSIAPVANKRSEHETATMSPSARTRALADGACRVQAAPSWPHATRVQRLFVQEISGGCDAREGGRAQWHGAGRAELAGGLLA